MTPATRAPKFEPYTREFAADPYPVYAALRKASPVFYSEPFRMTFVSRYADIFRALTDRRLARSIEQNPAADAARTLPYYDRYVRFNLLETEGDTHMRLRGLLGRALNPKRSALLSVRIRHIAQGLVEQMATDREVDFISQVAEPLPVTVISELLGWPQAERHRLRPWAADIVRLYEKDATPAEAARAEAATREFATMLGALADERKAAPEDDLVSALAALESDQHGLSRDELISSCMLLLNAGHEATVNAAGNGLLALLRHEEAMQRLRSEPALIDKAVEEMLRYDAPLHLFHRYALQDLTIAGISVRKGGKIGLLYGAANRDGAAFPDPDTFNIARDPNRHLSFGAATHFCLGASLARLELRTLFRTLLARTARIELAGNEPGYQTGLVFRGLKCLTIRAS